MKFAALALALISMVGLSSCLDGSGNSTGTVYSIMKVNQTYGSVYFTTPGSDVKYVPSNALNLTTNSALAWVYGEYNSDEISATSKQIPLANVKCDPLKEISVGDEASNQLVSCEIPDDVVTDQKVMFWGTTNDYCVVAMYYYVQLANGKLETTEINKHNFYVYANPEEDLKDGVLTVHLRHTINGLSLGDKDIKDVYTSRVGSYMYFNMNYFKHLTGTDGKGVSKIKIAYQKTSTVTLNPTVAETVSEEFSLNKANN